MVQEDLNEDFCALADTHTKAIGRLLEDFHDDQLLLMLDTERAFNDTAPDLTEATEAQWQERHPPSLVEQYDTKNELDISLEPHLLTTLQPDTETTPKEEQTDQPNPEGILDILTEDWEYDSHFYGFRFCAIRFFVGSTCQGTIPQACQVLSMGQFCSSNE